MRLLKTIKSQQVVGESSIENAKQLIFNDNQKKTNLVEFFRNSPLVGEIEIKKYFYINA